MSLRTLAALIVTALLSGCKTPNEYEQFPWLVQVSSQYKGEDSSPENVEGHGFLIEAQGRYFVVTASHVSQGGVEEGAPNLELRYWNTRSQTIQTARPILRLAHTRRDVEIIEVQKHEGMQTLATWRHPLSLNPAMQLQFPNGILEISEDLRELFEETSKIILNDGGLQVKGKKLAPKSFLPLGLISFLPKIPVLAEKKNLSTLETFSNEKLAASYNQSADFFFRQQIMSGMDATDGEFVASSPTYPGMSGLPLIQRVQGNYFVSALVSSSSRNFQMSWFTPTHFVLHTLIKLLPLSPSDGAIDYRIANIFWKEKDGYLYRAGQNPLPHQGAYLPFYFEEVPPPRIKTGNGTRADSGNGTRADSGNGTRAESGNGTRADSGNGTRADSGDSSQPKLSLGNSYNRLRIRLGDGDAIEASAFSFSLAGRKQLLPADMASLNLVMEEIYKGESNLSSLKIWRQGEALLPAISDRFAALGYQAMKNLIRVPLKSSQVAPFSSHKVSTALLELRFRPDQSEDIELDLRIENKNFHTTLSSSDLLAEVLLVEKSSGEKHLLELSGIFYLPTSTFNVEHDRSRLDSQSPYAPYRNMFPNPPLHFRLKSQSGEEFRIYLD